MLDSGVQGAKFKENYVENLSFDPFFFFLNFFVFFIRSPGYLALQIQ